jgi:ribose/xylose/arabinose/galactoside ABC-type transport system permease subunit
MGLFLLLLASGWFGREGDCTLSFPTLLLTIVLYHLAGRYYERSFGRVQRANRRAAEVLIVGLAMTAFVAASGIDASAEPPVSVTGLVMAGFLFMVHATSGSSYRRHYLLLASGMAGLSLMPLIWPELGHNLNRMLTGAYGLAFVVGGLLDHLVLVRTLKPAPDEQAPDRAA